MSPRPPRVVTVPVLPRNRVDSFIVVARRPVLVDAGIPGSAPGVLAALDSATNAAS